ncbi:hypothetical protein V1512DRAFT_213702 [Lipomyces arxii]|uniref:uncharacterized protein n=1 Tax=Lipomyces arxii TaxID=56418 RepID=UPI0034CE6E42
MELLDKRIIERIQSEVSVPSIARCVSELVQNSLDASAWRITVRLDPFTMDIVVKDNGCGIMPQDLPYTMKRYFTSKCKGLDDLNQMQTLGFRGEALSSISAVSALTVTSRHVEFNSTFTVSAINGSLSYCGPSRHGLMTQGTVVTVQDLFARLPVRRKYVTKSVSSHLELGTDVFRSIEAELVELALLSAYKRLSLDFRFGSTLSLNILNTPSTGAISILKQVLGDALSADTYTLNDSYDGIHIKGVVSTYTNSRRNLNYICRYLLLLLQSVSASLDGNMKPNASNRKSQRLRPLFVLHVDTCVSNFELCQDPTKVLHHFCNERLVQQAVLECIGKLGSNADSGISLNLMKSESLLSLSSVSQSFARQSVCSMSSGSKPTSLVCSKTKTRLVSKRDLHGARVVAQICDRYIMATTLSTNKAALVLVIDQHAADERVKLESLLNGYTHFILENLLSTQKMEKCCIHDSSRELVVEISVSYSVYQELTGYKEQFNFWGIRYCVEDTRSAPQSTDQLLTIKVTGWPYLIFERCQSEPTLLQDVVIQHLDDLASGAAMKICTDKISDYTDYANLCYIVWNYVPRPILRLLHSKACRSAVMFGDSLSRNTMNELVSKLAECQFPFQCAHGRPTLTPVISLASLQSFSCDS